FVVINPPGTACVFYKMVSAEATRYNLYDSNSSVYVKLGSGCKAVEVNDGGLIKGKEGVTC
ncbi:hypothetical protein HY419_00785, partial [candidate division WWE3 bacterium]|nr:hypothetical protein [candidate division WWE3 bacterium]